MPFVFLDKVDAKDLQIIDSSNWTIDAGILPNGDNAAEKTSETGARTFGVVGAGMSIVGVWNTIEFWIRPHAEWGTSQVLLEASTIGRSSRQWQIYTNGITGSNANLICRNEGRGVAVTIPLSIDNWHYVAAMFLVSYYASASAANYTQSYVDGTTGPSAVDSGVGRLNGAGSEVGLHIAPSTLTVAELAKVARYTRQLTSGEASQHYTQMIAA